MLHIMNSTRHAAHRHTQPHACVYANATVPDSEQQMSQRYARVPSFYVNFTHMPAATRSVVSALCPCALPYVYFTHMAAAAIAEGSCLLRAWSGCSVITGFLQQPTSSGAIKGDIAARCPGTGSTWHKCLTLHTCLLHTLCCCKLVLAVWVQGSRSTAAHTECEQS
jgi:hypothetical protein